MNTKFSFVSLRGRMLLPSAMALIILNINLPTEVQAKICPGDLQLTSQAAVDAFDYTEVTGNLFITGDIRNLNALTQLKAVGGNLVLQDVALENVDGLSSLSSVGGTLQFKMVGFLNLDGLSALTTVGSLRFWSASLLTGQFSSLTNVEESVQFIQSSVSGVKFPSLTKIGGLGFEEAGGSLDGVFPKLTTIVGSLVMHQFTAKNLDGLSALSSVGGNVSIIEAVSLENVDGLSALRTIPGNLKILFAPLLSNVDGLSHLTSVGGYVHVELTSLENIDGLSSLTSVGGYLYVYSNQQLTEFCGLWRVLSAGGVGGDVTIGGNGVNPTVQEIIAGGPCVFDSDRDGVPDGQDICANSDLRPTVWILNCDSRVHNRLASNGCSLADRVADIVAQAVVGARNHGEVVSRTARALNRLVGAGIIIPAEHQALMNCVGSSRLP